MTITMPTAEEQPLLPLETWRSLFAYHPWHFWGMGGTGLAAASTSGRCSPIVPEHAWQQSDAAGREELRQAILSAESILRRHLGWGPAPRYAVATLPWPRYEDPNLWQLGLAGGDGRWMPLIMPEGELRAFGVEARTVIDAAAAVTLSDQDGDGIDDTFSVSAATTLTDASEVAVYFAAADRYDGSALSERWRVAPVRASIFGGSVTITGPAWLLVRPMLYQGLALDYGTGLDPADATIYAATLTIARRSTDPTGTTQATGQGYLTWETSPHPWGYGSAGICGSCGWGPASPAGDPAATGTALARLGIRDARAGIAYGASATYDAETGQWRTYVASACRPPDTITVRYLAGAELAAGQMRQDLATVVARLAAAELARPICACDTAGSGNRALHHWQFDLARTAGAGDEAYGAISASDLDNPIGTRRGHVQAWQFILQHQRLVGLSI